MTILPPPSFAAQYSSPHLELGGIIDQETIDVQRAVARVRAREHARRRHDQLAAQLDRHLWADVIQAAPAPAPKRRPPIWRTHLDELMAGVLMGITIAMLVVGAML